MQDKCKLVAISTNQDQVFLVKNVSEQEYKKLLNKQHENESENERHKAIHIGQHNELGNRLKRLEKKDLILAKSVYDNFVDKGLLENDANFQKNWFDFYFNDKELDLDNCPVEFSKILDKVGNF